jgi:hypothetical protein
LPNPFGHGAFVAYDQLRANSGHSSVAALNFAYWRRR